MISDIISDALDEIDECERANPETYAAADIQHALVDAKTAMRKLLALLDAPPTPQDGH